MGSAGSTVATMLTVAGPTEALGARTLSVWEEARDFDLRLGTPLADAADAT